MWLIRNEIIGYYWNSTRDLDRPWTRIEKTLESIIQFILMLCCFRIWKNATRMLKKVCKTQQYSL